MQYATCILMGSTTETSTYAVVTCIPPSVMSWWGSSPCLQRAQWVHAPFPTGTSCSYHLPPQILSLCWDVRVQLHHSCVFPQHLWRLGKSEDQKPFEPLEPVADGNVSLLEFAVFLCQQVCICCTFVTFLTCDHFVQHTHHVVCWSYLHCVLCTHSSPFSMWIYPCCICAY